MDKFQLSLTDEEKKTQKTGTKYTRRMVLREQKGSNNEYQLGFNDNGTF